jgi:hypothetical protein
MYCPQKPVTKMRSSVLIAIFGHLNLILHGRRFKFLIALHVFVPYISAFSAMCIRNLQDDCGTSFVKLSLG